jgi:O-antigen/teichoic acid export membrane protein
MLLGQGTNVALQAVFFVLFARFLGVNEYGVFAGAFALVNTITPYSALGSGMLFMRYVSADKTTAQLYWGNSLAVTAAMTLLFLVVFAYAGPLLTGIQSQGLFASLVIANCLFSQITALSSSVFQTFENMVPTAILTVMSNVARLAVLLIMQSTMGHATASQWAVGILVASTSGALVSLLWVASVIERPKVDLHIIRGRALEGFGFSFAGTTQGVYNDVDKVMLSHYGLTRENGFYSLAYRLVDVATAPIHAIDSAVLPRYFHMSKDGPASFVRLVAKTLRVALPLGISIALATMLASPLIPRLVGCEFSQVLIALRWLCWLPLLRGIHQLTGSALTGTGHQGFRTCAQCAVAVANLGMNILWIPRYGWIGAAWSSIACDGLLGVLNMGILFLVWRQGFGALSALFAAAPVTLD